MKDADFSADFAFGSVIDDGSAAEFLVEVGCSLIEGPSDFSGLLEIGRETRLTLSERTAIDLAVASGCRLFGCFIRF